MSACQKFISSTETSPPGFVFVFSDKLEQLMLKVKRTGTGNMFCN